MDVVKKDATGDLITDAGIAMVEVNDPKFTELGLNYTKSLSANKNRVIIVQVRKVSKDEEKNRKTKILPFMDIVR